MTDAECTSAFAAADQNKDGSLTEIEAGRYFAAVRMAQKPVDNDTLTQA